MNAIHHASLAAAMLGLIAGAAAGAGDAGRPARGPAGSGFVVLELYTSEGCSSCPPADALLEQLVGEASRSGRRVYALSLHVDYWDRLGWRDPFSSASATRRQSQYRRRFGLSSLYTPEMVVNGDAECVGSNATAVRARIERSLSRPSEVTPGLSVTTSGRELRVHCSVPSAPRGAMLNLAWVQSRAVSSPAGGENAGRSLGHVNVVRDLRSVELGPAFDDVIVLHRPGVEDGEVIAWVQAADVGTVLGAGAIPVRADRAKP